MMSADDLIDRVKLVNSLMDAIFLSILVSTIPLTVAINVDRRDVSPLFDYFNSVVFLNWMVLWTNGLNHKNANLG